MVLSTLNLLNVDFLLFPLFLHYIVGKLLNSANIVNVFDLIDCELASEIASETENLCAFALSVFCQNQTKLFTCHDLFYGIVVQRF